MSHHPAPFADDHWDDLLDFIEQGKVLPIVGDGAVTYGDDNRPLHPALAEQLATRLEIARDRLPAVPTISDVVQEHLKRNGERNLVYSRLHRILREPTLTPGKALRDLAAVEGFRLFLTTTFDPLLGRALDAVRHDGRPATTTLGFFPGAAHKDLPCRAAELPGATVYHLLGRASVAAGEFVAWEEDLLDFLIELPRHLSTDAMRNLSADLRSHAILAIGLSFSDWISRLLLRIARQEPLSRVSLHSWLAEGPPDTVARSMVLFFGGVSKSIQVVECLPSDFAAELARRWRERHPRTAGTGAGGAAPSPLPVGPVFLSYAREDEAIARRVKQALESRGCSVYFDRERLGTGLNFHHELQDQIEKRCSLFVSIVSPFTEAAVGDNYFRRERYWASKRAEGFSDKDRQRFYLPFVVHEKPPAELHHEPQIFAGCQWNLCPGGEVPEAVAMRVAELQRQFQMIAK